nr:hypothetical protein [Tanacetum cinerariifolium]
MLSISSQNKEGLGYSVVPPPPAQLYLSPKKDLSWTGLPECADDTVTDYSRPTPTIEITSGDDQNKNPSITKIEASDSTILSKPAIKFVKAVDRSAERPTTNKVKTAKKPSVKGEKGRTCPTYTHKSITPRPGDYKPYRPSMRPMRSNMNAAQPKRTSFNKPAHSYNKRPFQETTQDLMIILIQRVQRLERELKARALIHNVNRVRSRPVMAWVPKKD